jgi:outer membrane lipoprotein-sorting protein
MIRFLTLILATLILGSPAAAMASDGLLARMAALNPNLHSYTATLDADVTLRTFPFLSAQLKGTVYHKEPGMDKVVFSSGLPMMAQQFDKLFAHIVSPAQWADVYTVTVVSDDGTTTTFKLVPRKKGNVDSIDAKADDKAATVQFLRWNYANGGYAELHQRFGAVSGNTLPVGMTGHVEEPGYTADITSTLDKYTINPPISDEIFQNPQ